MPELLGRGWVSMWASDPGFLEAAGRTHQKLAAEGHLSGAAPPARPFWPQHLPESLFLCLPASLPQRVGLQVGLRSAGQAVSPKSQPWGQGWDTGTCVHKGKFAWISSWWPWISPSPPRSPGASVLCATMYTSGEATCPTHLVFMTSAGWGQATPSCINESIQSLLLTVPGI